jgi:CRP-like cAMP-binding protein
MALILKNNKLFEWIDSVFLNTLVDNSTRLKINSWEYILKQFDENNHFAYFIQQWDVEIEIDWNIIKTVWEWEIFWEIALITNEKRTASVKATTDLVLLQINKVILEKMIRELPNWKEIQKTIFSRIMENNKR